jgi:protein tweety
MLLTCVVTPPLTVLVRLFRLSGHQTLGRLPSHHSAHLAGPNNGKYATLSKQCKTLESNDFYWDPLACSAGAKGDFECESRDKRLILSILDKDDSDKDPRNVSGNSFNRFDPKYVSIGPKNLRNNLSTNPTKCATLKHGGRFGGSLSPNPKNIAQPVIQPQHLQLQQQHLQKPNNQELEIQTYQLQQQSYQQQQQQLQQSYNVATVSRDYNQHYPTTNTIPYQKPGTGFTETSSILKKHRDEVHEMVKPQPVFSIDPSQHRSDSRSSKSISIINQPLPEIPKQHAANDPQVLSAANLSNYRSLQRPQSNKQSYPSATMQRSREREPRPAVPAKVSAPPILPPKNRQQSRSQQQHPSQSYQQQPQYPSKSYEREKSRERLVGRSYDDSHQYRSSSKHHQQQQQQQQNFQTLPHHHHHPTSSFNSSQGTSTKSNRKSSRSSREMTHSRFENYSATEL